jgi:hypothetical protein
MGAYFFLVANGAHAVKFQLQPHMHKYHNAMRKSEIQLRINKTEEINITIQQYHIKL